MGTPEGVTGVAWAWACRKAWAKAQCRGSVVAVRQSVLQKWNKTTEPRWPLHSQNLLPITLDVGFQSTLNKNPRLITTKSLFPLWLTPGWGMWRRTWQRSKVAIMEKVKQTPPPTILGQQPEVSFGISELKNLWFSSTYWKIERPLHRNLLMKCQYIDVYTENEFIKYHD